MEFTTEYEEKKELIYSFLENYNTLEYDQYKQSILNKNGDYLDYWLCDDDKCVESAIKRLREELPKYTRLTVERDCNDGDHDSFECCTNCGKPLNNDLTWYEDELDYLIDEIKSKEDLIEESNCFKVVGLLKSTGWLSDSTNSEKAKVKLLSFIDNIISFGIET